MKYNLDDAYRQVGEYGRAQWLVTFVTSIARNAGTYFYYPFAYFVLKQKFLCTSDATILEEPRSCSVEDICLARSIDPSFSDYTVDTSYKYYLDNWYTKMDLLCESPATIGFLISAYYIGYTVGGVFWAFPDRYGRKFSTIFGLVMATVSQTGMLISHDYWVNWAMFFLSGLSQIKIVCSYIYLSECTSSLYKPASFTYINIVDAAPLMITCLFYMLVSPNVMILPWVFTVLSYAAVFASFLCPESPRWLLVNGRSQEAIAELNKIASMNGKAPIPSDAIFVEDPTNIQAMIEAHSETEGNKSEVTGGQYECSPTIPKEAMTPLLQSPMRKKEALMRSHSSAQRPIEAVRRESLRLNLVKATSVNLLLRKNSDVTAGKIPKQAFRRPQMSPISMVEPSEAEEEEDDF